jgi:alpha-N-arabinofuranosidase
MTITNVHARLPIEAEVDLRGLTPREIASTLLAHEDLHAHNTFEQPEALVPAAGPAAPDALSRWTFAPASVTRLTMRL